MHADFNQDFTQPLAFKPSKQHQGDYLHPTDDLQAVIQTYLNLWATHHKHPPQRPIFLQKIFKLHPSDKPTFNVFSKENSEKLNFVCDSKNRRFLVKDYEVLIFRELFEGSKYHKIELYEWDLELKFERSQCQQIVLNCHRSIFWESEKEKKYCKDLLFQVVIACKQRPDTFNILTNQSKTHLLLLEKLERRLTSKVLGHNQCLSQARYFADYQETFKQYFNPDITDLQAFKLQNIVNQTNLQNKSLLQNSHPFSMIRDTQDLNQKQKQKEKENENEHKNYNLLLNFMFQKIDFSNDPQTEDENQPHNQQKEVNLLIETINVKTTFQKKSVKPSKKKLCFENENVEQSFNLMDALLDEILLRSTKRNTSIEILETLDSKTVEQFH